MRSLAFAVAALSAVAAHAHPGHGATPAHVHAGGLPVDLGALVFAVVVGVGALVALKKQAR